MTCHLFLDNFSWNFMTFGWFSKVKSFETEFCFKKTQISRLWYHEMFVFSEFCLSQKTFYYRKLIVFSCLQFADCYIWPRICLVVWFLCFNHYYGIFWKVSLKKSWCCRKHVFVFEIVSLKGLNKFLIKLSLSLWLLGKRFLFAIMEEVWKLFHFGSWLLSQASLKVIMCSLFLDTS